MPSRAIAAIQLKTHRVALPDGSPAILALWNLPSHMNSGRAAEYWWELERPQSAPRRFVSGGEALRDMTIAELLDRLS